MSLIAVVLVLLLLAAVLLVIAAPLRPPAHGEPRHAGEHPTADEQPTAAELSDALAERERREHEREQLEAAREAKYREIRDAELDYRTGKLSRADYEAIDVTLRAEAVEILRRIDAGDAEDGEAESD